MSPGERSHLQQELEIHQSLCHPYIAQLLRVYETEEEVKLVMEHMEGGDLFDVLDEYGKLTEAQVARIVTHVLQAVSYLHGRSIAHRDIKLDNVLRTNVGAEIFKVSDFGLAAVVGDVPLTARCGSLEYVAPEVLGESYTETADLWSVGVMTYVLLTGLFLYSGDEDAVKNKIRMGQPDWSAQFATVSADAQNFVKAFLVLDPEQRLSATDALSHPWLVQHGFSQPAIDVSELEDKSHWDRNSESSSSCHVSGQANTPVGCEHPELSEDDTSTLAPDEQLDGVAGADL